jgi:hypothetical protein
MGSLLSFSGTIPRFELQSLGGCTFVPESEDETGTVGVDFPTTGAWLGILSKLALGDAPVLMVATAGTVAGEEGRLPVAGSDGIVVALRPKNESKPPPVFFFPSSAIDVSSFTGSTTFHPAGVISSWVMLGFALIDASHEVDPFDDI